MFDRRLCRLLSSFLAGALCCGGVSVASDGKKEDLGPSVVGKSSRRKKAVAAGAVVGSVTLLGLSYLGKLVYDVRRDVKNLFKWLDRVIGHNTLWQKLSGECQKGDFTFEKAVSIIRGLLFAPRRPVFDLLVRFVDKDAFMNEVRTRYSVVENDEDKKDTFLTISQE